MCNFPLEVIRDKAQKPNHSYAILTCKEPYRGEERKMADIVGGGGEGGEISAANTKNQLMSSI